MINDATCRMKTKMSTVTRKSWLMLHKWSKESHKFSMMRSMCSGTLLLFLKSKLFSTKSYACQTTSFMKVDGNL